MELTARASDLRTLLRVADEPCLYVCDEQVHRLLVDQLDVLLHRLETGFRTMAERSSLPEPDGIKKIYEHAGHPGDFRIMAFDDGRAITVKLIGSNEAATVVPDKISVGKLLLVHPLDHFIMGMLDVCVLSSLRTAMGVLVAYRAANLPRPTRLGVIGAGRIGMYVALAFHRAGLIDECLLADPSDAHVAATIQLCQLEGGPVCHAVSQAQLISTCDAVVLATSSRVPLLSRRHLQSSDVRFVASVGADSDTLSELADDIPGAVRLLAGSPLCTGLGDLKRWRRLGLLQGVDLRYLTQPPVAWPASDNRPVCYVSTGFPLLDHVAARLAFESASARNIGRWIHGSSPVSHGLR